MNGFVLAGVAIAAFAAGAALVSFRYERELRRMARFLDQREPTGNARMTAFVRTRGVLGIARGVNAELDELQNERIASQQARQAFQAGLTCLSHDIRTPLAGAQGYLQLVEDEADPAAKERYLSAAAHRLDDVRVLLDDLFSFAQVHDPSFEVAYEPVRPADVLGDVLAGLYPQFRERGWEPRVLLDDEEVVQADAEALARIFRKEPMSALQWVCLVAVFIGMLFGNNLMGFNESGFFVDFNLVPSTPEFPQKGLGDAFGLASGFFYGASMFFNGYRKDADTTARGVWNFIFAVLGAGVITVVLNSLGANPGMENWALNIHFTAFNWIGALLLWVICGPVALGFLLVAGRNLPAADYGTIAYWEVPVAIFVGLVVFGEALTVNTILGGILIIGGGAIPSIKGMLSARKMRKEEEICENLAARLEEEEVKEHLQ